MGYWHDMHGSDYAWMIGMMVFWVAVVAGAVWAAVTLVRRGSSPRHGPSAREELDRRFARGEISEEEYTRWRDMIVGPPARPGAADAGPAPPGR